VKVKLKEKGRNKHIEQVVDCYWKDKEKIVDFAVDSDFDSEKNYKELDDVGQEFEQKMLTEAG